MSDNTSHAFGQFVPGFDFLQNIAKGASQALPQMPTLSNWIAPTLNVEELDKRISELKAVQFWLEQNSNALAATIQALEVQKMTLATLKGMNFQMGELAEAMRLKPAEAAAAKPPEPAKDQARTGDGHASAGKAKGQHAGAPSASTGVVDPLQWWGALTQQFQQIAADAMQDAARAAAIDPLRTMATGAAKTSAKSATPSGAKPARKAAVKSRPARKAARKAAPR